MRSVMLRLLLLAALTMPGIAVAEQAPDCTMTSHERERLLSLDFDAFDQDHEGGWRGWDYKGCGSEAEELIRAYLSRHDSTLTPNQRTVLRFHAGQVLGFAGREEEALEHFRHSYDAKDTSGTMVDWNAYVDATIAFIEKDRPAVEAALAKIMQQQPNEGPFREMFGDKPVNSWVVQGFLDCFDKPYSEAYGECAQAARERPD